MLVDSVGRDSLEICGEREAAAVLVRVCPPFAGSWDAAHKRG